MNDLFAIARRAREYADEPGISKRKQQDLLVLADVALLYNAILNAAPDEEKDHSPIPG